MDNNENEEEFAVDSLTADLAAAWEESEPEGGEEGETEPLAAESGGWEGDKPNEEPAAAAEGEIGGGGDTGTGADDFAPKSLSATAREAWRDTPAAMKSEITKREQDFAQGIQKYAESAKRAESMDRSLQPYQQYMQMNGGPAQSLQTLLQTGSGLQMGTPVQKAEIVANIIAQYGIDIQTLDGMLSGNGVPQEVQQQNQMEQMFNQRLGPMQQQLNQYQQREQYEQQQAAGAVQTELSSFSQSRDNEFYADVRMQMADIMDLASNRGQNMGLKEAYDTACQLNPEIKKIVDGRALAASSQSRRRAGSSIHGTPGGPGGSAGHNQMRDAIEDAWDSAGRA